MVSGSRIPGIVARKYIVHPGVALFFGSWTVLYTTIIYFGEINICSWSRAISMFYGDDHKSIACKLST
jgi:hypothetical protein